MRYQKITIQRRQWKWKGVKDTLEKLQNYDKLNQKQLTCSLKEDSKMNIDTRKETNTIPIQKYYKQMQFTGRLGIAYSKHEDMRRMRR